MRLLLVEDSARAHASVHLNRTVIIDHAESADDAVLMTRYDSYDLVLLNAVSLPQEWSSCVKRLRQGKAETPVIVLTERTEDNVRALTSGADDAVQHTVAGDELYACIMAVIRRHRGYARPQLEIGNLSLCLITREVRVDGSLVRLTPREYAVLEQLVLRRGLFVSKDMLLSQLYGELEEPEAKIIDVFICKLRKKLDRANASCTISTTWRQGWSIRPSRVAA
jgi:two-component system cell cycle response regulator CtrA